MLTQKIGFAIPTWNRADLLERCVESIASQSPGSIVICDNASTDHTSAVCDRLATKYPCVKYFRFEEHVNSSESMRRAVNSSESEFTWTFGDDDQLLPGALAFVESVVSGSVCDFIHVSESRRASETPHGKTGTVFEIANQIGLTDFTGFMSCNIAKTNLLKSGFNSKNWPTYSTSSFPQSLAILDAMADNPSMILQVACVESPEETEDTRERWRKDDVCWRYLHIGEGLKLLCDSGKIPKKVSETFFRYLDGVMFGRFMHDFSYRTIAPGFMVKESEWDCFEYMASMVDGDRCAVLVNWVKSVRKIATEHQSVIKAAAVAYESLTKATDSVVLPSYPLTYLPS